jgi:taurine dioxygenase
LDIAQRKVRGPREQGGAVNSVDAGDSGYRRIQVHPLAGALGAEIGGVDLASVDDGALSEIRRAWLQFHAVFFRGQHLTAQQMEAFALRLGPLTITPYVEPIADTRFVHRMVRHAEAPAGSRNYGDRWHMDQVVKPRPIAGILLYSIASPAWGGDTLFSNLHLAYDTLSDGMKTLCDGLTVMHSPAGAFTGKSLTRQEGTDNIVRITPEELQAYLARETPHPLVRVHPETGRKLLYISGDFAVRFDGMTVEESRPILDYLNAHAARPDFTCRFRWTQGALGLIDNRCCQHYAVNDYSGFRREMLRIELDDAAEPRGPQAAVTREAATA